MDRLAEYHFFLDKSNMPFIKPKNDKFYDTLVKNLNHLKKTLKKHHKYVDILVIEEKYQKILKEARSIFLTISIDTNQDEELHFEGIKVIINLKLNRLEKALKIAKNECMKIKIELEPELSKQYQKENRNDEQFNIQLEEENKKILQKYVDTSIQATRKRVVEIQEIQNLIGLHIEAQDERIDNISVDTKKAKEHIKGSKKYIGKGNGRLARRILFLFILCLSFVLCFLHLQYRK
ncbi:hypothetical protein COBT_000986 [Conglomerata obtusa]